MFYLLNGHRFDYDDGIRGILKRFGTDESDVDETRVLEYLRTNTTEIDLAAEISEWRDDLVRHGLDRLADGSSDPND